MKTIYLDCGMGAAGDMLAAALLELLPEPGRMLDRLNGLGLPGVVYEREITERSGIRGSRMHVRIEGDEEGSGHEHAHGHVHGHTGLKDIEGRVASMDVPPSVKEDILAVFRLVAEAESRVHGKPVPEIHFHEVGSVDAIADITAVCLILNELSPEEILASPVHVGCGTVRCAHGLLPVPTPATAEIFKGVPIYGGSIEGELCTPTGAALLKHFVSRFGDMPAMEVEKTGYGMGKKEFERLNCLRAFLGESADNKDKVCVLSCNVDDMSAEDIGFALERLLEAGAKDAFTVPLGMKKNRPGTMICVICAVPDGDRLAAELFRHTSTIGIRRTETERYVLERSESRLDTRYGPVRVKRSKGYGTEREKIEYEDLARIAREQGGSVTEIRKELEKKL